MSHRILYIGLLHTRCNSCIIPNRFLHGSVLVSNSRANRNDMQRRANIISLEPNQTKTSRQRGKKRISWSMGSVAMLILPAFAFSLGCWQVYRLQWKLALVEQLRKRLTDSAIDFPVNDLQQLDSLEYRRVRISGEFLNDREFLISPRGRFDPGHSQKDAGSLLSDNNMSSHGAHVITPFKISGTNMVIMVNRGWVPMDKMSRQARLASESHGNVTIEAIVRKSESRPQFMNKNEPERGVWFYKDFNQMAKQHGTLPIYVDSVYEATVPGGPIGGQTNVNVRNDHLSYLITWYSLTAVTLMMWLAKFRK